jgi:AcrR family transcriptional regulator
MNEQATAPMSGRRAQAARNDRRILEAARRVFIDKPDAPISAVAAEAGVGISALYRRYPSKEELLRQVCAEGLTHYIAAADAALADDGDAWDAFAGFMRRIVDADTHSVTVALAGTFDPSEELYRESGRGQQLTEELFERTMAAGVIRTDLVVDDLTFLFEQIAAVRAGDEERTRELRLRYLALHLDALRSATTPLPGPPPGWEEVRRRWQR